MNTYDFDKTIFYPDSTYCFYRYCLKKYPIKVLSSLPGCIYPAVRYKLGKTDAAPLKEKLFSFLKSIPDIDSELEKFWDINISRVEKWYLAQQREDDIIISASPEFLLRPVAERLGFRLIGTRMDKRTGKITGPNCHDSEKVLRFNEAYPGAKSECFYSDSLSDSPMAEISEKAVLVDKGKLSPWPEK